MNDDEHRILPRYTQNAIVTDPLEIMLAQRQAEIDEAKAAIANGTYETSTPLNPRGWPIQTKGVSGTSPHTQPLNALIAKENAAERRRTAA